MVTSTYVGCVPGQSSSVAGAASRTKRGSGGTALSCASTPVAASLSTEELLEQVWDENADPFTNTVFNTLSAVFGDLIPIRMVGKDFNGVARKVRRA